MKNIIAVKNLCKDFKIRQNKNILTGLWRPNYRLVSAVKGVSFSVCPGESVALLGPNGAGKTTTIKSLTGLIYPSSGEVSVLGFNPSDRRPQFLSNIGLLMGNKTGMNWDLTANQSFYLLREIYGLEREACLKRIAELAQMLAVGHVLDVPIRKLSLGERMKLELIGSILHDPKVLFLDEPTIGLDIVSKKKVRDFLRQIQKKYRTTIILTSHDMVDVETVCDRVIVISKGEKVYDGLLDELWSEYSQDKIVDFYFESISSPVPTISMANLVYSDDSRLSYRVKKEHLPDLIATVAKQGTVLDIDISETPLEDIIEALFNK
jgi:ABC-2 type transport system ATP-binding protein